jgi:hypothetical protein
MGCDLSTEQQPGMVTHPISHISHAPESSKKQIVA